MLFGSFTQERGIKITFSLRNRVYFTLGLTLEQGRFFPESWLIAIKYSHETPLHSLFALWLIVTITVYRYIFYILRIVWNRVPIFAMFVWNRVANSSFFLWNRSRVSSDSAAHPLLSALRDKLNCISSPPSPPSQGLLKGRDLNWSEEKGRVTVILVFKMWVCLEGIPFCT